MIIKVRLSLHYSNFFPCFPYGYTSTNSIILKSIEKYPDNGEPELKPSERAPLIWAVQNGELTIRSRSEPDNVGEYLQKLRECVDEYIKEPRPSTKLTINLEYLNGITSHYLYGLIRKLYYACNNFLVIWEYRAGDDYSLEQGHILASICKAKFKFVRIHNGAG